MMSIVVLMGFAICFFCWWLNNNVALPTRSQKKKSVLPGILQGDKSESLLYGSVDNGKKICWSEDFHSKVISAMLLESRHGERSFFRRRDNYFQAVILQAFRRTVSFTIMPMALSPASHIRSICYSSIPDSYPNFGSMGSWSASSSYVSFQVGARGFSGKPLVVKQSRNKRCGV